MSRTREKMSSEHRVALVEDALNDNMTEAEVAGAAQGSCESLGEVMQAMRMKTGKIFCPSARGIDKRELVRGTKVELEHTRNRATARCIALVHLHESARYYKELAKMERRLKGR